jgi:hypothetical protein
MGKRPFMSNLKPAYKTTVELICDRIGLKSLENFRKLLQKCLSGDRKPGLRS